MIFLNFLRNPPPKIKHLCTAQIFAPLHTQHLHFFQRFPYDFVKYQLHFRSNCFREFRLNYVNICGFFVELFSEYCQNCWKSRICKNLLRYSLDRTIQDLDKQPPTPPPPGQRDGSGGRRCAVGVCSAGCAPSWT